MSSHHDSVLFSKENVIVFLRFLSALCEQTLFYMIPLLFYVSFGDDLKASALAFSILQFSNLLAFPLAGFIISLFFASTLFFLTDILRAVVCLFIFFLLQTNYVYVFLFLYGFASGLAFVNIETVVPTLFEKSKLSVQHSLIQMVQQSTAILGPALATLCLYFSFFEEVIIFCCGVFLINGMLMKIPSLREMLKFKNTEKKQDILKDTRDMLRLIAKDVRLLILVVGTMIVNFAGWLTLLIAPRIFDEEGGSRLLYGLTMTATALVAITGVFLFMKKKVAQRLNLCIIGLIALCLLSMALSIQFISKDIFLFALGLFLFHTVAPFFVIFMRTRRTPLIPDDLFARCAGILVFINSMSIPLAGVFVNQLGHIDKPRVLLLAGLSLMFLLLAAFIAVFAKEMRGGRGTHKV